MPSNISVRNSLNSYRPFQKPWSVGAMCRSSPSSHSVKAAASYWSSKESAVEFEVRDLDAVLNLAKITWPKMAFFAAKPPSRAHFSVLSDQLAQYGLRIVFVSADWKRILVRGRATALQTVPVAATKIDGPLAVKGPGLTLEDFGSPAYNVAGGLVAIGGAAMAMLIAPPTAPMLFWWIGGMVIGSGIGMTEIGVAQIIDSRTPPPAQPQPQPSPTHTDTTDVGPYDVGDYVIYSSDAEISSNDPAGSPYIGASSAINVTLMPPPTASPPGSVDDPFTNGNQLGYSDGMTSDGESVWFDDPSPFHLGDGQYGDDPGDLDDYF